jgi:hypothetical protein
LLSAGNRKPTELGLPVINCQVKTPSPLYTLPSPQGVVIDKAKAGDKVAIYDEQFANDKPWEYVKGKGLQGWMTYDNLKDCQKPDR